MTLSYIVSPSLFWFEECLVLLMDEILQLILFYGIPSNPMIYEGFVCILYTYLQLFTYTYTFTYTY